MRFTLLKIALLSLCCMGCADESQTTASASRAEFARRLESVQSAVSVVDEAVEKQTKLLEKLTEQNQGNADNTPPAAVEAGRDLTPPALPPVVVANEFADWYVVEWTQQSCPPCKRWEASEKPILEQVMSVRVIDINAEPVLAKQHGIRVTPTIQICRRSTKKVRAKFIGYTPASAIKDKIRELNKPKQVASDSELVSYGSHWSIGTASNPLQATRDEIVSHLKVEHGVSGRQVARLTAEQLLQLHDSLHWGRQ